MAFECRCWNRDHNPRLCTKSRTALPNTEVPEQGRPLGYMAAWLLEGAHHADTECHKRFDARAESPPSLEQRIAARALAREQFPNFARLERDCERGPLVDGEPQGPERCP